MRFDRACSPKPFQVYIELYRNLYATEMHLSSDIDKQLAQCSQCWLLLVLSQPIAGEVRF
jgi:hypothetical protein